MKTWVPFDPIGVIVEHEQVEGLSESAQQRKSHVVKVVGPIEGDERARGGQGIVGFGARRFRQFLLESLPIAKRALHAQWRAQFRQGQYLRFRAHVFHSRFLHQKSTLRPHGGKQKMTVSE